MDYDLLGMKFLIVEDTLKNAELIHKFLKRLGLKIFLAKESNRSFLLIRPF
jgi:hypothetical protein